MLPLALDPTDKPRGDGGHSSKHPTPGCSPVVTAFRLPQKKMTGIDIHTFSFGPIVPVFWPIEDVVDRNQQVRTGSQVALPALRRARSLDKVGRVDQTRG